MTANRRTRAAYGRAVGQFLVWCEARGLAAARRQWRGGSVLRRIAPATAVLGLGMQLVWLDAATYLNPITGTVPGGLGM